jgi:hypothetical protein
MTTLNFKEGAPVGRPRARAIRTPGWRRTLFRLLVMTAACLAVLPASSAFAGRLFATGHDLDLHCHFGAQCGYVDTAVTYVRGGAPDPAKPVLILERLDNDFSAALTNTFGAGTVPSVSMDPRSPAFAIAPLTTSLYSAILIGSDVTCGGCDLNEFGSTPDSDAINARTADIATFFNAGGGLLYGSGAGHGDGTAADDVYYQSAPLPVGGVPVAPPFTLTAEGTALGLTPADANCCATHNSFVDPPAGSSITVAERDSAGSAETLFTEGTIVGGDIFVLTLTPATAENPVGTSHEVTATLTNQDGPVASKSVLFTVSGANSTSGSDTTDASGEATFSYTGANPGPDTITACADINANATCDPDEPTEEVAKTWTGIVNRPPDCSGVRPDLRTLWPPNHKYRLITLSGATDPDGDTVTLTITGVTQDEPLNGLGDGDTSPDAKAGPASEQVFVRAERSGQRNGRVYRIAFSGSDGKGGTCTGSGTVGVPHDQGTGKTPVDSGQTVNSFGP